MKKKIVALCLSILFALSSMTAFAKGYTVDVDSLSKNVSVNESFATKNELKDEKLKVEYDESKQSTPDNVPEIGCKAVYLINPDTGKVIFAKDPFEKMYPASTTKLMTALMTLENCDMDDKAVVTDKAVSLVPEGYSSARLEAGEEFSIYTLLQSLLIPSGNEAANALALHISGDIDSFAELCNKRAKELGCKKLHFINPNGVHNDDHYCCAYDMYLIARECKKYDSFNEIVMQKSFTVPTTDIHPENDRVHENTNQVILPGSGYYFEYCTGIKTGHTQEAGECLISSASKDGMDLICVCLGGKIRSDGLNERFYDTKRLYEYAYENYGFVKIAEKDSTFTTIKIDNATKETADLELVINDEITSLAPLKTDKNDVKTQITLLENIKAPIKQGQILGKATFEVDGFTYTTVLKAKNNVERNNIVFYLAIIFVVSLFISIIIDSRGNRKKKRKR